MRRGLVFHVWLGICYLTATSVADESLYRYEGNVLPHDASAGWEIFNPCEDECNELLEDGHFVLFWPTPGDRANYNLEIARAPTPPPPTLWVEWRYRSNHPLGPNLTVCDGEFSVRYDLMLDSVRIYGDAVISREGGDFILGLDINDFNTYRFESLDGIDYKFSVDGEIIFFGFGGLSPPGLSRLQLRGQGGCGGDKFPNKKQEWDYVRYGTISFGEQIIATDPPSGLVSPQVFPNLDRFVVTFDSPNYAYIDNITVQVTGGIAPQVIQTRRRETDEPDTLEIVLDRPLPEDETTTFTFNDSQATNEVVFAYGCSNPADNIDTDGDGVLDCFDDCPTDPNKTAPGQCGCGTADTDSDGDSVLDCFDGCSTDPNKTSPGQCGCGSADIDTDGDGTADCKDSCPTDPNKTAPGQCGCGQPDDDVGDSDGDGVVDCVDQCPGGDDTIDLNENSVPDCAEAIPTVSHWGLVVLTLLLLTLAKCAPRLRPMA